MPPAKRKKSSQPPSQEDGSLYHTTVATPEIEVSLVDRMKKRFSTRNPGNPAVSDPSPDAESDTTAVSLSDDNPPNTSKDTSSGKKTAKRNSLGQRVTQIDKVFSPETRLNKVFRSPTRFPSKAEALAMEAAASESDDGQDETRSRTNGSQTGVGTTTNRENEHSDEDGRRRSSHPSVEESMDESEPRQDTTARAGTPAMSVSMKKPSKSPTSVRSSRRGREVAGPSDGGGPEEPGGASQESLVQKGPATESPSQGHSQQSEKSTRRKTGDTRKGTILMASGDVEAHMADKEFISNQVRVITMPFILESGPRSWMQVWKGQQSSHNVDPPDIPASVINRIVTKINLHMEDVYQRGLGRQRQRHTLMSLDELRKAAQEKSQKNLTPELQQQASLQEIISSYPSEWSHNTDEEDTEMSERYSGLRARLFALSRSLSASQRQRDQFKSLAEALQRINTNLEKCSPTDLERELNRTGDLVSQIKQKLEGGVLGAKQPSSQGDKEGTKSIPLPTTDHATLVKALFKTAVTADTA